MTVPISAELCLAGRDLTEPRPSPDTRQVAFIARSAGPASICLIDVEGGPERMLTTGPAPAAGRGMFGGCFDWCEDGAAIIYAAVDGQLWRQPLDGTAPTALTSTDRLHQAPTVAGSFVVCMIDQAEITLIDLADGRTARLDTGADGFCFDPAVIADGDGLLVAWQAWSAPSMPWDDAAVAIVRFDPDRFEVVERRRITGSGAIQQPRWCPDGRLVSIRDDDGWLRVWHEDRPVNVGNCEAAGPTWGPGQQTAAVSPDGSTVAIAVNEAGFGRLLLAGLGATASAGAGSGRDVGSNRDAGRGVIELGRGIHGQVRWAGTSVVAVRSGARTPTQIVVYAPTPTGTYERRILAVGPAAGWDAVELSEPEAFAIDSAAGPLPARLYSAMGGTGRLLCLVHGGPTDQWPVMFLPRVAFWQSRGFEVLVVDPRGTTGHGRQHQQALHGGWGIDDVDDTALLIADTQRRLGIGGDRTAIAGSSSGGLTVLSVMARHAGLVAGGIAAYPVSDLAGLADSDHRFEAHYTWSLVGPLDTEQDRERYHERSPVFWDDRVLAPLLLLHGDADPVVPVEQSRQLVASLERVGSPVDYHEFAGEGHGWRDPAIRRLDLEMSAAFLDRICPP